MNTKQRLIELRDLDVVLAEICSDVAKGCNNTFSWRQGVNTYMIDSRIDNRKFCDACGQRVEVRVVEEERTDGSKKIVAHVYGSAPCCENYELPDLNP
ncbi:hypothetical protein GOV07_05465 [Candidatus Woesearchaeota archaeon]|nr:hypothetical protein [Candidatus Woesearchaeota archaeon]